MIQVETRSVTTLVHECPDTTRSVRRVKSTPVRDDGAIFWEDHWRYCPTCGTRLPDCLAMVQAMGVQL